MNDDGNTPLLFLAANAAVAFASDPILFIRLAIDLVNGGSDVNHQNRKGRTAIHELCHQMNWSFSVLFLYMFPFVDVNGMDMAGETPLHIAAYTNQPNLVEVLLEYGALPDTSGVW